MRLDADTMEAGKLRYRVADRIVDVAVCRVVAAEEVKGRNRQEAAQ